MIAAGLRKMRRAAQNARMMRLCIQVRSFDAMCKMIAANLGIGVLPLEACQAQNGDGGS